jgi:hypothetical protein
MATSETPGRVIARQAGAAARSAVPQRTASSGFPDEAAVTLGPGIIVRDTVTGQYGRISLVYRTRPGEALE